MADELFDFFGVDPTVHNADEVMWTRLAGCIFPALDAAPAPLTLPKKRGAPPKRSAKNSVRQCRDLADRWDKYKENLTNAINRKRTWAQFCKDNPEAVEPFKTNKGHVSYATALHKMQIGRLSQKSLVIDTPVHYAVLVPEVAAIYEALAYDRRPWALGAPPRAEVLQKELLALDIRTDAGKARLQQIRDEVEQVVPEVIRGGMLVIRPYWRREKRDE